MAVVDVTNNISYTLSVQQTPATEEVTTTSSSEKSEQSEITRINYYLAQLEATRPYLPTSLRYVVTDGFYSKIKWVDGVRKLKLEAIAKLRRDANLRYLYQGEYSGRGRPRKYGGQVDLTDYSNFKLVTHLSDDVDLYTAVVWSMSLKRQIRVCYLLKNSGSNSSSYAVLFSTDLELDAYSVYLYYKARFQIEFLFRDGKLRSCTSSDKNQNQVRLTRV